MTIWGTHLQLSEGCSLLKHLPSLDDLFDFENDYVDRTVNWAESAPLPLYDTAEDGAHEDEDEDEIPELLSTAFFDRMTKYEWLAFKESGREFREEEELREDTEWMKAELARRRAEAPKNLRHRVVQRTRNRLQAAKAERFLNPGRHQRLRVGVYTRPAQLQVLVCNADFTSCVKRCLCPGKLRQAA